MTKTIETNYKITDEIYASFYLASTGEEVERLLKECGLSDIKDKNKLLRQIMRVEKSYSLITNDTEKDGEELEYEINMATFLEGTWRVI